ncbi:helix-turn-helix domain-containing protein [Phytohabitans suffuscus]|uniref:Transcriptional regulator n=1 Tax=Phytohabitans suffuscus TaxID=624315 RepID=A0A6F8YM41_9ACTN|nr:helix-turn-helix transcriptional regulator [Phytohabitans suffuscus]BCB87174.1 transcriptional regulator [Phytohabitans suffuscus]
MDGTSPTVQRRRLGLALRTLRQQRGLTGEQVGERVERSASWISRVEGGRIGIRGRDLRDLLDLYQVDDAARRAELLSLAEKGRARSWWSEFSGTISEAYATFIGFEDEATRFESYEPMVVPGLLQLESYARALVGSGIPRLSPSQVEDRIQVRLRRQEVLRKPEPLHLSLILQESVLRQRVGSGEIMRDQLRHLVESAQRPNVDLRILLDEHTSPIGSFHHFVLIYLESDAPDSVYVEDFAGGRFERAASIRPYQETFERFNRLALDPGESITKIELAMRQAAP